MNVFYTDCSFNYFLYKCISKKLDDTYCKLTAEAGIIAAEVVPKLACTTPCVSPEGYHALIYVT